MGVEGPACCPIIVLSQSSILRNATCQQLPGESHLGQEVTSIPAGGVARQPDAEEGLQSGLRSLALGQLLAAS